MGHIQSKYADVSSEDCLKQLKTSSKTGLLTEEVKNRQKSFGFNELEEKKDSLIKKLLSYFWGPIPWMIEIALILSGSLERWPDFFLILSLLLINALLGFFHEFQADHAIAALKEHLALKSSALRDGKWKEIESKELVPGDIVSIKLGNIVPADIKLISEGYLSVDQSILTGESLPQEKKQNDMLFSGSAIKLGEMTGVVTETGMNTFFGNTARLIQTAKTESHFQKTIVNIGRFLIATTLAIAAIILVFMLYTIEVSDTLHENLGDVAIFLLVLIVAGIPVALPAVSSVTMAIGAHKMAKFKAIVSKLMAIEELAGMRVLCSDKTGTLTKNELSVGILSCDKGQEDKVLLAGSLASELNHPDAIDQAIFKAFKDSDLLTSYKLEKFTPFDPVSKKTTAIYSKDGASYHVSKGAPQVILDLCQVDQTGKNSILKSIDDFAKKGFRTLAVADSTDGKTWQYLGLIPLFDPPRDDTQATIEKTKALGIDVKMVTGDHLSIAKEIAAKIGIGDNIHSAKEALDQPNSQDQIENSDGFAEVFPEHKFEIVKNLQQKGFTVGMTGDGVNDAPALKQADIGIAVSKATDAARASADLILTEDGLSVITAAIEEARKIFGRLKSYAIYRVSETCRLLFFLLFSLLIFHQKPLSAIMIILIALLNDIPIMTIAYDHMTAFKKPTKWNMKEVFTLAVGLSVVGVVSTFGLYWIGKEIWHLSVSQCNTLNFLAILCGGNLTIYLTRTEKTSLLTPMPEKKFFVATLFSQITGTLLGVYGLNTADFVGIGWKYVGLSWAYIAVWFFFCYLTKLGLMFFIRLEASKRYKHLKS